VYEDGDVDAGIWSAGIAVGLIKDVPTCEELLRRIEREAEEVIDGLAALKSKSKPRSAKL
jgi:NAD(P)H-dependent flavin oxidoreductase YrpB (nitropropane dioxygenase family)